MEKFEVYYSDEWSNGEKVRDDGCVMIMKHNDKILYEKSDGGEPEDNSFGRDWSWVAAAIRKAYDLGFADGKS